MRELRCTQCSKLLAKTAKQHESTNQTADIEMKCPKCKAVNRYKVK